MDPATMKRYLKKYGNKLVIVRGPGEEESSLVEEVYNYVELNGTEWLSTVSEVSMFNATIYYLRAYGLYAIVAKDSFNNEEIALLGVFKNGEEARRAFKVILAMRLMGLLLLREYRNVGEKALRRDIREIRMRLETL